MSAYLTRLKVAVLVSSASKPGLSVSATTTVALASAGDGTAPVKHRSAASSFRIAPSPTGGGDIRVFGDTPIFVSANQQVKNASVYVSASTGLALAARSTYARQFAATATTGLGLGATSKFSLVSGSRQLAVSARSGLGFYEDASKGAARIYRVVGETILTLAPLPVQSVSAILAGAGSGGFSVASSAAAIRVANASAESVVTLGQSPRSGRDIAVLATSALGFADSRTSNRFYHGSGSLLISLDGIATAIAGGKGAESRFAFRDRADARVLLPRGGGTPGGTQGGVRTVLLPRVSGEFPNSYAETPSGLILVANGIDPMHRWDALTGQADTAGVLAPPAPLELGGVGVGTITGRRVAYCRFIDRYGNASNPTPASNEVDFGRDRPIQAVTCDPATGVVTVRSADHGLATGEAVVIEGVGGLAGANGTWTIARLDADRFTIDGLAITSGRHTGGGRWAWGVSTVVYGSVPLPSEPKVARRQILRNLEGSADTFYVDIDTDDLSSTAFYSTKSDADLAAGLPVALFSADDETPMAMRHGTPPSHKAVVAAHLGRIFAAGEVSYAAGNCEPVFGQPVIRGVGTAWRGSFKGRVIYMVGASRPYEIASVDEDSQEITTTEIVNDATGPFTPYAIRPQAGERRFVYFSEPGQPEAWPEWNAIGLPEDSDEITGLMVKGSFLYVLERRHIYKFTFQGDPARDGFVFLATRRGCVNNRCHVQAEDTAYLLDEVGIHRFDGQDSSPLSTPIQSIFQQAGSGALQVNWNADTRCWHAAHDPVRDTIRWFVAMTGHRYPRHAICHDYRRERWWIEEYPFAVTSSTIATIGFRRSLAGSESRRIVCLGEGSLDAVDEGNGLRGPVTSAGPMSLTDSSAPFPANLAGAPVSIAAGRGMGQQRRIASNTADTLRIDRPWNRTPDATSVYQIGGINWTWRTGWFRFVDQEQDNSRDVEVVFQPLKSDSSVALRMYYDHDESPRNWARSIRQDGIETIEGEPEVGVDLTHRRGSATHRLTGHGDPRAEVDTFVSVELAGVQAGEPHRIYSVTINGVRPA